MSTQKAAIALGAMILAGVAIVVTHEFFWPCLMVICVVSILSFD